MSKLNVNQIVVGDVVGIFRSGSLNLSTEGKYAVIKVDKVKVVIQRESDKYERTFSAKSGDEKGSSKYRSAWLVSEAEYDAEVASKKAKQDLCSAWQELEQAAHDKSITKVDAAMIVLRNLVSAS